MSASTSFDAWLKLRRKLLDLPQEQLARKVECTTSLLQKIEPGERRPSRQIVELLADALAIILRSDHQDDQGTAVAVARKLDVPRLTMIINKVPQVFNRDEVKARIEQANQCDVLAVLPHSANMLILASLMRRCYAELGRAPDAPLATI